MAANGLDGKTKNGAQASSTSTLSGPRCRRIGHHPTMHSARVIPGLRERLVAPPVVLGCGQFAGESIEIVGYDTPRELCFTLDRPRRRSSEGGECLLHHEGWAELCTDLCLLSVFGVDLGHKSSLRHMLVSGLAPLGTTRVRLVSERTKPQGATAVLADVSSPELLEALNQSEPFMAFGVLLSHCTPRPVRAIAEDESGSVIASTHERASLPDPCKSPPLPEPPG